MAAHVERNTEICRLYVEGATLQEVGEGFKLSRERVRQILRKNGVYKKDRAVEKSGRDEFLGVNITESDKAALREEASRRGLSMSALTSDLIKDMLASLQQEAR